MSSGSKLFKCDKNLKEGSNHKIVQSKKEDFKLPSKDRFYCIDCEGVFEKEFLVSHKNHKTVKETEFIKEKIAGWKDDINKIKDYEVQEKSHMIECEKKLEDRKKEILGYKDKVRSDYQKLMEVLKGKEELEYKIMDADFSRMQTEFYEYQGKIEKGIMSLQETRSNIENKLEEINNGLSEGLKNDSLIEQPQMNPHPTFEPHFSFQSIPIEDLTNLPPSIVLTKYCIGKYEAEEEKKLNMDNIYDFFQIDNNFIYASFHQNDTIHIRSLETEKIIKNCSKPYMIFRESLHILNIKERLYIIGRDSRINNKVLTFDEKGVKLHDFTLPSNFNDFSKGEAGKVFIECNKHVILYDPVTKKQECIIADVDDPRSCCSLGGDDYCMAVRIEGKNKLVKVVNGGIVKVVDVSVYLLSSNGSGMVCRVDDDNENMMHVMDQNLDVIFKFEINYSGNITQLNMDDAGNIHILSGVTNSPYKYYVKKCKMIRK